MRTAPESRLLRGTALAFLCATALFAVGACVVALRDQTTVLFADDWRMLDHYQSRPLLAFLFGSENGHRIPVTLALFAIDYEWLGGRMRTLVLASIACSALIVGTFVWIFRRQEGLERAVPRSVLAFACFALVWALSSNDLLRGIYHMSLQTVALLVVALAAFSAIDPARIEASRGRLLVAALAAFLATWSHGVGAASWAALLAVAVVRRFRLRVVAGLAAAGAAATAIYALTLPPDPKNPLDASLAMLVRDPAALGEMTLAFIGHGPARVAAGLGIGTRYPTELRPDRLLAHVRELQGISVVLGAPGLVLFAVVAVRRWRRPLPRSTIDSLVIGLMAFAATAALLVSFVRFPTDGPTEVVHPRFLVFSTLFWIGGICALVPRAPRAVAGPVASLAVFALPIVALAMLPALRDARGYHAATRSHASKLSLSLLLGVRNDALARSVSLEDAETVHRVAARLEAERRWPFDGARAGLRGRRLAERFATAPPCVGAVDRWYAIGRTGSGAVAGRLVLSSEREPPSFVVLVDREGRIRGLADFASVLPHRAVAAGEHALAWTGFIADFDPGERYTAYAVLADERRACPLRAR